MTACRPLRALWLSVICAGLAGFTGCGGGTSAKQLTTTPGNCSLKINAWDPPTPSDGGWHDFSKYILPNTAVRGVVLNVAWDSIETSQGNYDFSTLDALLPSYAGKEIDLAFQPISYSNLNNPPGGVNTLTPSYVFTSTWASSVGAPPLDVVTCLPYYPGNGTPTSGFPVVYEKPFQVAYQNFINAVLQHYKGSSIGYMRFGISVGNEADPYCTAGMQALPAPNTFVVPTTWENWVQTMDSFEKSAGPLVQLMESLNDLDGDPSVLPPFEAMTAVNNGFGFGNNGLRNSDIANSASGAPCSGNWCALFDKYADQVPLELQEAQPSNPSGSDPNNVTGNLADLIPVAVQHHATILEVLMPDLFLAFDPNYVPKNPGDSAFAGAYSTALTNCSQ
jgi:hypothetical protein